MIASPLKKNAPTPGLVKIPLVWLIGGNRGRSTGPLNRVFYLDCEAGNPCCFLFWLCSFSPGFLLVVAERRGPFIVPSHYCLGRDYLIMGQKREPSGPFLGRRRGESVLARMYLL
jgi:hypothetical protein